MQDLATEVAAGMTVHDERMRENLELTHGALFSQRALTALVESGMTRDDAYRVVQENAQQAWDTGTEFRDLLADGGARARPRRGLRLRRLPDPPARDLRAARSAARLAAVARVRPPMILYTCGQKTHGPAFAHPCAKAGKALDAAGYEYELKTVGGYRLMPWTWGSRDDERAEVKKLSGTNEVPILVLDDGEVISGSGTIARWAKEHPQRAKAGARQSVALDRRASESRSRAGWRAVTTTGVPALGERVMLRRPVFSGARVGLVELAAGQHLAQDDPHLELGEGGAEAAADAAAEGDPGVGVGRRPRGSARGGRRRARGRGRRGCG